MDNAVVTTVGRRKLDSFDPRVGKPLAFESGNRSPARTTAYVHP
ncbi:hypothetical protein VSH64_18400 [Amycolatopsis rhabdoformis]|uniref:Uncharacterized protein n=1 Tax=Amycolatopsis rhabdoformis TaxID=1448059 RepID=A0ABZ1IIR4_9PSEU|nr:hypothetical protein [Amycolatopsis rhabdoformis]WSE34044.1 hypothetical protein VSH64_18400 [Amycolatopsis rhabdoformis]